MSDAINQGKNLNNLVDIRDVKIDRDLLTEERVRFYVQQMKDPYCFRVGDVKVRVFCAAKDQAPDDSFSAMIAFM